MHYYIRVWKFKPSLTFIAIAVIFILFVFNLLAADILGLISLGSFGVAIAMLLAFLAPIATVYEEVKAEKIAEFEVDREWEVKNHRWLYLLSAIAGIVLGVKINIVFFALLANVILQVLISRCQKVKVSLTDRGVCYQRFLIEWSEIRKIKITDNYVILYKNPFSAVAVPKDGLNIVKKFV